VFSTSFLSDDSFKTFVSTTEYIFVKTAKIKENLKNNFNTDSIVLPPLIEESAIMKTRNTKSNEESKKAIVIGKNWPRAKFWELSSGLRHKNVSYDWLQNEDAIMSQEQLAKLKEENINQVSLVDKEIINLEQLSTYDFAVIIVSPEIDVDLPFYWTYEIPEIVTTSLVVANLPMLAVGHKKTSIRQFVDSHGLGLSCPYLITEIRTEIDKLLKSNVYDRFLDNLDLLRNMLSSKLLRDYLACKGNNAANIESFVNNIENFQLPKISYSISKSVLALN